MPDFSPKNRVKSVFRSIRNSASSKCHYPPHPYSQRGVSKVCSSFEVCSLCNSDLTGFYAYDGSLTYPECNEIVHWVVMENPLYLRTGGLVSKFQTSRPQNVLSTDDILFQLTALRNLLDENGDPLVDNYRPTTSDALNTGTNGNDVYHYTTA